MGVFSEPRSNFLERRARSREFSPELRALGDMDSLIAADQIRRDERRGSLTEVDRARQVFRRAEADAQRRTVFNREQAGSAVSRSAREQASRTAAAASLSFARDLPVLTTELQQGEDNRRRRLALYTLGLEPSEGTGFTTDWLVNAAIAEQTGQGLGKDPTTLEEAATKRARAAQREGLAPALATIAPLVSGEAFFNRMGAQFNEKGEFVGGERGLGTRVMSALESFDIPGVPDPFGELAAGGFNALANPTGIATVGITGGIGGFGTAAGEVAGATLGETVAQQLPADTPMTLRVALPIVTAALGASTVSRVAGTRELLPRTPRNPAFAPPDPSRRLIMAIDDAVPIREATLAERSTELAKRAQSIGEARADTEGFDFLAAARRAQKGELPRSDIEPLAPKFTPDDITALGERIRLSGLSNFDAPNAMEALQDLLINGRIPTRSEQRLLQAVFGDDLTESLARFRPTHRKVFENTLDALNVPRSILSSFDLSAPFRQGALFIRTPEFWRGFKPMVKAFFSENFATQVDSAIASGERGARRDLAGVYRASLRGAHALTEREEAFQSSLAERLPLVGPVIRASERAYVTFLNKLRADVFDSTIARWERHGRRATPEEMQGLARRVNWATGRGSLPASDVVAATNAVFFSPRLYVSRLEFPTLLASKSGRVRAETAKDLVGFVGTGVGMLTLFQMSGLADEVELDPRSSDFGRIRIGNTRIDPWAGFQPIARTIAQVMTGDLKPTGTPPTGLQDILSGDVGTETRTAERWGTALRHGRSKLAPVPAFVVDLASGQTFLGDEFDATNPDDLAQAGFTRFVPLGIQDILEGVQEEGLAGGLVGLPGFIGFGVNSYSVPRDTLNEIAGELFSNGQVTSPWYSELDKGERDLVRQDQRWSKITSQLSQEEGIDQNLAIAYANQRLDDVYEDLESELRKHLEAGIKGKDKRTVIQEFLRDRFIASDALFDDELFEDRDPLSVRDAFAEQYWTVTAPVDYTTGDLDFSTLDARRQEVLDLAVAAGVDPIYITGEGPGTWRGVRFADPVVAEAVQEYQGLIEQLRTTGYFTLKDEAWAWWVQEHGLDLEATYGDWVDAEREAIAAQFVEAGVDERIATIRAGQEVAGHVIAQRFNQLYRNGYRHAWVTENAELARAAADLGIFTPDSSELRFLAIP